MKGLSKKKSKGKKNKRLDNWTYFWVPVFSIVYILVFYFLAKIEISGLSQQYWIGIGSGFVMGLIFDYIMMDKMIKRSFFSLILNQYDQSKTLLCISIPLLLITVAFRYLGDSFHVANLDFFT